MKIYSDAVGLRRSDVPNFLRGVFLIIINVPLFFLLRFQNLIVFEQCSLERLVFFVLLQV